MQYNFDEIIPRRNTHSIKWDSAKQENVLPMWVADMDFRAAQPILDALTQRLQHGVFGYTKIPDAYPEAVVHWFAKRHHFQFDKNWLLHTTGVIPALSAIIQALTQPGDTILLQEPVYNHFFSSIRNNHREFVSNDLLYQNGSYSIDFEDLEAKCKDPDTKLLLLCHPHNPVGRAWTKEELMRIGEICLRNNVVVVADEIHCDLVYPAHSHVPFASLSKDFLYNSVTCTSPSKTFNLAGFQAANILVANDTLRKKIDQVLTTNELVQISPLAIEALIAAYNHGEEWLDQLKHYLQENYNCLKDYFQLHLPQFPVLPLEATYLVWIDCSALQQPSEKIAKTLMEHEQLWINEGTIYGRAGEGFIRVNIACPRELLLQGLSKIERVFNDEGKRSL